MSDAETSKSVLPKLLKVGRLLARNFPTSCS
jgi:hypothetical protein